MVLNVCGDLVFFINTQLTDIGSVNFVSRKSFEDHTYNGGEWESNTVQHKAARRRCRPLLRATMTNMQSNLFVYDKNKHFQSKFVFRCTRFVASRTGYKRASLECVVYRYLSRIRLGQERAIAVASAKVSKGMVTCISH